jgi:hypothetical protein
MVKLEQLQSLPKHSTEVNYRRTNNPDILLKDQDCLLHIIDRTARKYIKGGHKNCFFHLEHHLKKAVISFVLAQKRSVQKNFI